MPHIATTNAVYLVDFYGQTHHYIFDSKLEELGNLIAEHGKHGIVSIRQYQPHKGSFKKLSKKAVEQWFNWDTYSIEQLRKVNFIK